MAKLIFKQTTANQIVLFPQDLGERIPKNHPVRIVNEVVNKLKIDDILAEYKPGGTSIYHPKIMLKILFYAYFNNIYSCRRIEQALHENIYFMWISGNSTPDFRTINYFRGKRLKNKINNLFAEVVKLMAELGFVSLDIQYIDGTKIESASNKYSFVWKGSVIKNKEKLEEKIKVIITEIEQSIEADQNAEKQEYQIVNSEELKEKIEQLNERLDKLSKKQKKTVEKLSQEHLPRLKKYEEQLEILGERNSYSKTDEDATFMRMKEDHMKNGQLKPAYNLQISTENQIITNYSVHQRPGDTATLKLHLEQFENNYQKKSSKVIADAGYGSEENYNYLENNNIEAYVKYNYFHKEQKRSFKNNIFHQQNLYYNAENDYFVCPMGQKMTKIGESQRTSDLGYVSNVTYYQAQRCEGCPLIWGCHNSKTNRIIEINHQLRKYKEKARKKLLSQEGILHRKRRAIEPEAVFGQLKNNNKFNRFKLRGLEKVAIEFGLAAISHNLRKMAKICQKNPKNEQLLTILQKLLTISRILTQFFFKKQKLYLKKFFNSNFEFEKNKIQKFAA